MKKTQNQLFNFKSKLKPKSIALFLLLVGAVVMFFVESLDRTYSWQSIQLAQAIRPVSRKECTFPGWKRENNAIIQDLSNPIKVSELHPSVSCQNKKIALVYVNGKGDPSWSPELTSRIIRNRQHYCEKYGYDCIDSSSSIDLSRPPAWSKMPAVLSILETNHYDYVFYVDMDVVIMNFDLPLCSFLESSPAEKDFIIAEDWNGPNTGVWFVRNSSFSRWFLRTAWDQTHLVGKKAPDGTPYPFEYEQRAFHFLLDSQVWKERGLPRYRGGKEDSEGSSSPSLPSHHSYSSSEISSHFWFLPQCSFNSYSLHPLYWKGDREVSQYVPGDFLIHFAGKKGGKRVQLLEYYLEQAAE